MAMELLLVFLLHESMLGVKLLNWKQGEEEWRLVGKGWADDGRVWRMWIKSVVYLK